MVERSQLGGDRKSNPQNADLIGEKSTSRKIAAQLSINHSTVERAAELLAMSSRLVFCVYVIGRRYLVEKNEWGTNQHTKDRMYQNDTSSKNVREIIANQLNIGSATVIRTAEFTLAIDKIVSSHRN